MLLRRRPLCACINDDLGRQVMHRDVQSSVQELHQALQLLLPVAAPWEKTQSRSSLLPIDSKRFLDDDWMEIAVKMAVLFPVAMYCAALVTANFFRRTRGKNID